MAERFRKWESCLAGRRMQAPIAPVFRIGLPLSFAVLLAAVSWHTYHYPLYDLDMLGYMANVAVLETSGASRIHAAVYSELPRHVPDGTRAHLLGQDNAGQDSASRRDRAGNPDHFAEFLPCFAIRPLYIEMLHILRRLGIYLVRVTVLGSVLPYMALAALIFVWSARYVGPLLASLFAFLLAVTPPILGLARYSGPDSLSTFWTCLALYFIFERRRFAIGLVFLLSSVYIRTDNVLLALLVLAYLCLRMNELDKWKAGTLGVVAVLSVFAINHFAGDYGWRMLYYRGFIAAPLAPGEFVAQFSFADYNRALRTGLSAIFNGNFIPYLLFGLIGYLAMRKRTLGAVFAIVIAFAALHFVIFPLVEDRYFSLFYVVTGLTVISALSFAGKATTAAPILTERT
jgi:hypothetical protein